MAGRETGRLREGGGRQGRLGQGRQEVTPAWGGEGEGETTGRGHRSATAHPRSSRPRGTAGSCPLGILALAQEWKGLPQSAVSVKSAMATTTGKIYFYKTKTTHQLWQFSVLVILGQPLRHAQLIDESE